ncbi:MAG: tRNA (adenosine(37)-N6)-dimethylallyltransferase MiaA [Lentisphaerota bacterium]
MKTGLKTVVITGPTATGKTALAVKLAAGFSGEIISVDSRQVYRGMDIGTGKDLEEYAHGGRPVPYHLIDMVNPGTEYNLMEFCRDAWTAIRNIAGRNKVPVLCGGTPMYLNAILSEYELPGGPPDSNLRKSLDGKTLDELLEILKENDEKVYDAFKDRDNRYRLLRAIEKTAVTTNALNESNFCELDPLVIGVYFPRGEVHRRIEERLDLRLKNGMIGEVEMLHQRGVSWERLEFFGLEYRFIALHLQGILDYETMRNQLLYSIRQFAKRQDIWFRKLEREGRAIYWIDQQKGPDPFKLVEDFLAERPLPRPEISMKDIFYGPKTS